MPHTAATPPARDSDARDDSAIVLLFRAMSVGRKALIRQYKETPRIMGVGVVRNLASGKSLVVAGRDLPSRLNRHRAELRLNAHSVEALQSDWNAQGADAFAFEVLDTITPSKQPDYDPTSDLQTLELLWLEKLSPFAPAGYNRRPKRADG
jgi:hypothetical protein